jgi:TRAP-type C4-dicarboxylate transport system permease small subunit
MLNALSKILGCIFGYMCLALSVLVSAETIMRKLFDVSIQGADELGGYTLAIGSSLAFSVALVGRNHMRIDLLHFRMPDKVQGILNWLAILLIGSFGVLLAWTTHGIVRDTIAYHSTAPTPWATPLVYPQSAWYAGLTIFATLAVVLAVRATMLLASGRFADLNRDFQPKATKEELERELEDIAARR